MKTKLTRLDKLMLALTFAEANEPGTARRYAGPAAAPEPGATHAPRNDDAVLHGAGNALRPEAVSAGS